MGLLRSELDFANVENILSGGLHEMALFDRMTNEEQLRFLEEGIDAIEDKEQAMQARDITEAWRHADQARLDTLAKKAAEDQTFSGQFVQKVLLDNAGEAQSRAFGAYWQNLDVEVRAQQPPGPGPPHRVEQRRLLAELVTELAGARVHRLELGRRPAARGQQAERELVGVAQLDALVGHSACGEELRPIITGIRPPSTYGAIDQIDWKKVQTGAETFVGIVKTILDVVSKIPPEVDAAVLSFERGGERPSRR